MRIEDKFCRMRKEVLPPLALAIQPENPKTQGKSCRDSQNAGKALPRFLCVPNFFIVTRFHNKEGQSKAKVGFQFVVSPLSFHINACSYEYSLSQAHG